MQRFPMINACEAAPEASPYAAATHPTIWWLCLGAIFCVALTIRVALLIDRSPLVYGGDEWQYRELGLELARSGRYVADASVPNIFQGGRTGEPTAYRTPALPSLLALHYRLFGPSDAYPRITLVVFSAATCIVIGLVGRHLATAKAALLAAAFWAVWPPCLCSGYAADRFYGENLGIMLLLAHTLCLATLTHARGVLQSFVAGLLLGLSILARGFFLLIAPFSLLAIALMPFPRSDRLRLVAACLVGLTLGLGGWIARNAILLGRPVISTQTEALYLGNNLWARGSFSGDMFTQRYDSPQIQRIERNHPGFRTMGELERADAWVAEARACILQNPARFAWLLGRKTLVFWAPTQDWAWSFYRYHYAFGLAMIFMPFGAWRLALTRRRGMQRLLLFGPILAVYAAALMTYSHDRYRYTIEPFLLLIASTGLLASVDAIGRRARSTACFEFIRRKRPLT